MLLNELFSPGSAKKTWKRVKTSPRFQVYAFPVIINGKDSKYYVTFDGNLTVGEVRLLGIDDWKEHSIWQIVFGLEIGGDEDSYREDIFNTGGQHIKVFASVIDIVRDFVKRKQPDILFFTAEEPSRVKLYNRLAKQLAKMMGGKVVKDSYRGTAYVVYSAKGLEI
jgi:hypothetical protein